MFSWLKGRVVQKEGKFIVLEKGDIGFRIFCSPLTAGKISLGEEARIFTRLFFEREKLQLYGFSSRKELELFETLEGISGIGPKTALNLSSFGSLEKLKEAIESGKPLAGVKGIGKKRLQRIALELTGKIREIERQKEAGEEPASKEKDEAIDALRALGFSKEEAKTAILQVPLEIKDLEARIKSALKILGKR